MRRVSPPQRRAPGGARRPYVVGAAWLGAAACVLAVLNPAGRGTVFAWLDLALKLVAAGSAALLGAWVEERIYAAAAPRAMAPRLGIAALVPILAVVATPVLLLVLGVAGALIGDDGTLAVAVLAFGVWLGSAGIGSFVVLLLDGVARVLAPDLRRRFQVAVLGLLALAILDAVLVLRAGEAIQAWLESVGPGTLPALDFGRSPFAGWAHEGTPALASTLFFASATALALPALLSAGGKLADWVAERLDPLRAAFRALAAGHFEARVTEAGSRELRELGQSFNQMAESLVEAQTEVQRLNEQLEGEVAARTRELRAALEELQAAQTRLVETEKHAVLSRLTAGLLHEINSPLGALRSATDTIRRSTQRIAAALGESEAAAPLLVRSAQASVGLADVVVESTRRIEELMEGLRRFVNLDSADRKTIDLRDGLELGLTLLGPALGDRIRIERDWPPTPLWVSCFPARMNQVFFHLLRNAADALSDAAAGTLRVSAAPREGEVEVTIADTGRGIAKAELDRLFELGFTTKSDGRVGLRLGLPSSKRWLDEVGGRIVIESAPGVGTTVRVRMPLASVGP